GELHEAAGRLDAALGAVRAAMAAERRDHDRGARLRARLAAAAAGWAGSPSGRGAGRGAAHDATWGLLADPAAGGPADLRTDADRDDRIDDGNDATRSRRPRAASHSAPAEPEPARPERARARAGNWRTATGAGRRARRLAAEAAAPIAWSDAPSPELGSAPPGPHGASARASEAVAPIAWSDPPPPELGSTPPWPHGASARASEERDGAGGTAPDANLFADPAEAGHEPGNSRARANREAVRVAHRADQGTAPTARAASAPSGGSAHADSGRVAAAGASSASGSSIGDALLHELLENGLPARHAEPSAVCGVGDPVVFELDPRYDSTAAVAPVLPVRDPARTPAPGSGGSHRPEGPAADHGGNPGDPATDAGAPGAETPGAETPGPGASRPPGAAGSATSGTDGLGLGDLLAGALAAYRDI
ncbi:MAG: hypothetical protein JNM77_17090, partial [Pseudonocardia sp.]|nr:hypothetical protein [Pseudonocardia sp.]